MVASLSLDNCKFYSKEKTSSSFTVEKTFAGPFIETDWSEMKIRTGLISLLTNKAIKMHTTKLADANVVLECQIENGSFEDVINSTSKYLKVLTINSTLFHAFINSSQAFYDSLMINEYAYSASFALLEYVIESIANVTYLSKDSKRKKLVRFARENVVNDQFLKKEIRHLTFIGKTGNERILFKKLLERCYLLRCKYVHKGELFPVMCRVADKLSLAFIANAEQILFPSYSWLRRIAHLALTNFLDKQNSTDANQVSDYVRSLFVSKFKSKKVFQKG